MENTDTTMTATPTPSRVATGIKYGIAAAVVYILLLLLRYLFFSSNPMMFTGFVLLSYIIILVFFVVAAVQRKKELGGYADLKDLFTTVFIVILFAEIAYTVFNYIYLNYIDPDFFDKFMEASRQYLLKIGASTDALDQQMQKMEAQREAKMSISNNLLGMAMWIAVDSVIGFIIALIIRKPRPQQF